MMITPSRKDYSLAIYDDWRTWIKRARDNGKSWDEILLANTSSREELKEFLDRQNERCYWHKIDCDDWEEIVLREKINEEKSTILNLGQKQSLIHNGENSNGCVIPSHPYSSWVLYKKKLEKNGFDKDSINNIEEATIKILRRLKNDTTQRDPVKGLVIGNVQSGKTANMAALMAMAADNGWNLFIILSGTIDNLRKQTETRLFSDLNDNGNLSWNVLKRLSSKSEPDDLPQSLHFKSGSIYNPYRYFTVCLKNSTRLKDLIQWLQFDPNTKKHMKILVIDDEADQAGINTADISEAERTKINQLICNLVNGKNEKSQEVEVQYQAMNYVGYTATPYANVLNEAGYGSLYPKDFISTLAVSKEYFGPQQIFGINSFNVNYEGLDIIREIGGDALAQIQDIHRGFTLRGVPQELEDSLCWFLCGVACLRYWHYDKPTSMLIHTSQITNSHEFIANVIKSWFKKKNTEIIQKCRTIWERETARFTLDDFKKQYYDYKNLSNIKDYPLFEQIKGELEKILNHDVTNIPLERESEKLKYHEGIHLCIDNCNKNGVIKGENDTSMIVRLVYPPKNQMPSPAPAFIVVGGSTLSRGLTIEGLISTFFLRATKQADSLMQMGRWFGYRRGFELIPRIWLTGNAKRQFEFLSVLDQELRDEIERMEEEEIKPSEYGPRVRTYPKVSFIRITAKNKMQEAEIAEMDFSGSYLQTYLFDKTAIEDNLKTTEEFISSLGASEKIKELNKHAEGSYIWRNVDFSLIRDYLSKYKFPHGKSVFSDIEVFCEWIDKLTNKGHLKKWNVILVGKDAGDKSTSVSWQSPVGRLNLVTRSQKNPVRKDGVIDIGALRDPIDIVKDVDLDGQSQEVVDGIKNFKSKFAKRLRKKAGMGNIPQLLVYIIDKNSKARESKRKLDGASRCDLDVNCHIAGICLNVPEDVSPQGERNVARISIDMSKYSSDLEDINAD